MFVVSNLEERHGWSERMASREIMDYSDLSHQKRSYYESVEFNLDFERLRPYFFLSTLRRVLRWISVILEANEIYLGDE